MEQSRAGRLGRHPAAGVSVLDDGTVLGMGVATISCYRRKFALPQHHAGARKMCIIGSSASGGGAVVGTDLLGAA